MGDLTQWAEADKEILANTKYFKPEINIEYQVSFADVTPEKRPMPVWEKGIQKKNPDGTPILADQLMVDVTMDSLNGQKVDMLFSFSASSKALYEKVKSYDMNGVLKTWLFSFKKTKNGNKTEWLLTPIKQKPAAAAPATPSLPEPLVGSIKVDVIRMPGVNMDKFEAVAADGSVHVITKGKQALPAEIASTLIDHGCAVRVVEMNLAKAI